jgi:hypothetical protein
VVSGVTDKLICTGMRAGVAGCGLKIATTALSEFLCCPLHYSPCLTVISKQPNCARKVTSYHSRAYRRVAYRTASRWRTLTITVVCCSFVTRSLHDVHEIGHVCLSAWFNSINARLIWMNLVWKLCHWGIPKVVLFNFLQSVIPTWRTKKLVKCDRH